MHVIAHDPYASADRARAIGVELVSMEEAMTTADFISLHMPLTPATDKMLNDEAFAKMKKGVRIINVARGGVIDEDALVRALDAGIVAQVCLVLFHLLFMLYYIKSDFEQFCLSRVVLICFLPIC
jgi:D-3-phosphoglycerate dehydrogenase